MTIEEQIRLIAAQIAEEKVNAATNPLKEELETLKMLQNPWVDTKTAMMLTGVCRTTLEAERDRLGTLLECGYEGTKPLYSRESIFRYNESRGISRKETAGRAIPMFPQPTIRRKAAA